MRSLEDRAFLLLLAMVSLALAAVVWPYYQAVLWGVIAAVVFAPLNRWLRGWLRNRPGTAALVTLVIVVSLVVVPALVVGAVLAREATGLFSRVQSGDLDIRQLVNQAIGALPTWASNLLERWGVSDLGDLQTKLTTFLRQASQTLTGQALSLGQGTFDLLIGLGIMLYLLFFLLRDGEKIAGQIRRCMPLRAQQRTTLFRQFVVVIRATVKGSVLVAAAQGALGGCMLWFLDVQPALLWAVLMMLAALVPAVGAALIWLPVAVFLFLTAAAWKGAVLIAWGVLVIGMVDNVLRPLLVGKDTRMPDYIVLISTLGGLSLFGASGLVIGPVIAALFMAAWSNFAEQRWAEGSWAEPTVSGPDLAKFDRRI